MQLWFWILFACLQSGLAPSAPPVQEPRTECPACTGAGVADRPCLACGGERTIGCRRCGPDLFWFPRLIPTAEALLVLLPEDPKLGKVVDFLRSTIVQTDTIHVGRSSEAILREKNHQIDCPGCHGGVSAATKKDCGKCGGTGAVACPTCKGKGERACPPCSGKGRARGMCETCNGLKTIAATALELPVEDCSWCQKVGWRECRECPKDGKLALFCFSCDGAGTRECGWCDGERFGMCMPCMGEGTQPNFSPKPRPKVDCKICKGSGKVRCKTCEGKGREQCILCRGEGHERLPCMACLGLKRALCPGCGALSARSWELGAMARANAKDFARAKALLRVAIERTERRYESLMAHVTDGGQTTRLAEARAADRKRLSALQESWKE